MALDAFFQREETIDVDREVSIYSRYVWKICIKETEEKEIIILTRSMIFFPLRRPGDVTLRLKLAM